MEFARTLTGWVGGKHKPIAVSEAEIRDELEFHLEMRARDNQLAGMSTEAAENDARKRFGDFEQQFQACRQVTLGLPIAIRRIQIGFMLALSVAVIGLGLALVSSQNSSQKNCTEYEMQLAQLRTQLETLRPPTEDPVGANHIPFVQWNPIAFESPIADSVEDSAAPVSQEPFQRDTLEHPWSDWQGLAGTSLPVSEFN